MAIIKIKLGEGECVHSVRENLRKALSSDSVKIPKEKYNDELMENLMDEAEKYFSKIYLNMVREIAKVLRDEA
jgi:hypothetical protein